MTYALSDVIRAGGTFECGFDWQCESGGHLVDVRLDFIEVFLAELQHCVAEGNGVLVRTC